MATFTLLMLAVLYHFVNAIPKENVAYRNTIFGDEKLEGGIFEYLNSEKDLTVSNEADNPYRLPTTTKPLHYIVLQTVDMDTLSFSGEVDISLIATQENVREIVFHAHDMNITSLELMLGNTTIYQTYTRQPEYHFLKVLLTSATLEYNPQLPVIYQLKISYESTLRTDMTGLYRNWFRNYPYEEVSRMASTHFQATAARFAFPCYDEPSFKATFDFTIRRPARFGSWFNTRRLNTRNSTMPNFEDDIYSTTPVMSTYLLAMIVAEYKSKSVEDSNGKLIYEVIARPAAMDASQGDYALNVGQELLAKMSEHTALDFYSVNPNLKMTQAAIPDFSAGAMENWGLLVYREAYVMYDANHTDGFFKQRIAYILSHEIAHMWFGNLVTCDWWDNLWLNEGFARYYQYFLTDWVEEYLGLGIRFVPEQVHTALLADSATNAHPLTNPGLGSPVEVRTMFTSISYNKGASIIRMTEHLIGFEVLRGGLRKYLRNRKFDTALPIHLFEALQEEAAEKYALSEYGPDFNLIDYLFTWSDQGGHPVLFVDVNHQTGQMTIYQRRFNINTGYATSTRNWIVPVTFATASDPDFNTTKPTHIIRDAITVINRNTRGDEWVIFNKQQTGFYRVNYDEYTWNLITMLLRGPNRTLVHEYNRAQIVDDVFQFARSNLMNYYQAFNIISFLENETEYTPWVAAITGFNWVRNRLVGTRFAADFDALFRKWATPIMNQLNYYPDPDETFMRSYLRYQIAGLMCRLEEPRCRTAASEQFAELRINGTEVPVDSRNWVYCNALRSGSVEDFNFLRQRFLEHNVYAEKIQILQTLGCTPHESSLNTFLSDIVEDNFIVRPQDYTSAFSGAVSGNENNTQVVFKYIQNNLQNVTKAFNSATTPLSYISARLRSEEEVKEFQKWADENQGELGTHYQAVYNGANSALNALNWVNQVEDDIGAYLASGDEDLQTSTAAPVIPSLPSTVSQPPIIQPWTPNIPDSANTSVLSIILLMVAMTNLLL